MPTDRKTIRVLIVDDNESDRLILRSQLLKLGFQDMQESEDGVAAEYKIDVANQIKQAFNIVFIDWMMPKLNGIKLLQNLRSTKSNKDLVVFMTTGKSEFESVSTAIQAGANDYIVKPISLDILQSKIEKHIKA